MKFITWPSATTAVCTPVEGVEHLKIPKSAKVLAAVKKGCYGGAWR